MSAACFDRWNPFRGLGLLLTVALLSTGAATVSGSARAGDTPLEPLRPYLAKACQEVVKYAKEHDVIAVAVGQVTAPARFAVNASEGIEKILIEELSRASLGVASNASTEIEGRYWPVYDGQPQPVAVGLLFRVVDTKADGTAMLEVPIQVDLASIEPYKLRSLLFASFGLVPPPVESVPTVVEVQKQFQEAIAKVEESGAPANTDETSVDIETSGPYGVQIQVKDQKGEYAIRSLKRRGAFLFADMKPDEAFRVLLINDTKQEAAVQVLMDGIDVMEFSKNPARRFLVGPGVRQEVKGWIGNDDQRLHEFHIKKFGESVFAEKGRANSGSLGMITVRFSKCYQEKPKGGPAEELPSHAIGRGTEKPVKVTEHQRWIDPGDVLIHVRYRVLK